MRPASPPIRERSADILNVPNQSRNYLRYTHLVILGTGLARLTLIGKVGLGDDEAHYWMWSQYLDWSYYDHPPMVAWIIALFTRIGGNSEFFVRIGSVLLFAAASYALFEFAKDLKDERCGFLAVTILNCTPVFSFLGSVLMVPDSPLGFAWSFFILFFYRATRHPLAVKYWLGTGAALGIALLSKYNAVFLPFSALLFLLLSRRNRFILRLKGPYLALGAGLLLGLPVLIWNARHDWASIGFQLHHGLGSDHSFTPTLFFQILGAQIAYLSPILFVLLAISIYLGVREAVRTGNEVHLFLSCFSLPALVVFNLIGSFHRILPHWPALGFLSASVSLAIWMDGSPGLMRWKFPALALGAALTILVPLQATTGLLPITRYFKPAADPTNDLYGWPDAAREIARIRAEMERGGPVFIYAGKFLIADQIGFYTGRAEGIYCFNEDKSQFDFWSDPDKLKGQNGLLVTDSRYPVDPKAKFGAYFERFEEVPPLRIYRNGVSVRTFYFYKSFGFKGLKI